MVNHGMSRTRFYTIWHGMKLRCNTPSATGYENYGGRGITICDNWNDFIDFKNDMHESYLKHVEEHGEKQTTIERINNEKGYSKLNCCWTTRKNQNFNRRHNYNNEYLGIKPTGEKIKFYKLNEFCRENRLTSTNVLACIAGKQKTHKKWTFKKLRGN